MEKCKECGFIHPPVAGGCPVARNAKRSDSEKGKAINNLITKMVDHLHSSDNWKVEVKQIKTLFKI